MADRKPLELTEAERRAAQIEQVLFEALRRINGAPSRSGSELPPGAIRVSELESASGGGQIHRVKLALNDGADVNEVGPFGTPLHRAAENGHLEIVRLLVEGGADLQLVNSNGETPQATASRAGHQAIAEYFRTVEEAGLGEVARENPW